MENLSFDVCDLYAPQHEYYESVTHHHIYDGHLPRPLQYFHVGDYLIVLFVGSRNTDRPIVVQYEQAATLPEGFLDVAGGLKFQFGVVLGSEHTGLCRVGIADMIAKHSEVLAGIDLDNMLSPQEVVVGGLLLAEDAGNTGGPHIPPEVILHGLSFALVGERLESLRLEIEADVFIDQPSDELVGGAQGELLTELEELAEIVEGVEVGKW